MGSHPTLAHHQLANDAHELDPDDRIHNHHHRPAERTSEQAFDQLNPTFGVPADRTDRIGHRDVGPARGRPRPRRPRGRPRQPPERPQPTRLAGRPGLPHRRRHPGRPHPAHSQPSGPRADRPRTLTSTHKEQPSSETWSRTPNSASPTTAPPSPTCGSRSPSASNKTASGATATPRSSRSTCGAARPNTWPTPSERATGSWSPADSDSAAGRPPRATSGRSPRSRPTRSAPP
jgi:hypothetical protein